MRKIFAALVGLVLPLLGIAAEPADTVTIFMIGDSTMANKPLTKENQERGWGQMLPLYFQGPVKIDNHAQNGRSSKSFLAEGRWDVIMNKIKPGDYVIIQFGHNDEKIKNKDRYTVPGGTFDEILKKYATDAISKGATPILMNAIVRRNFPETVDLKVADTDDSQPTWKAGPPKSTEKEGVILVDTHGAYLDSPRNVAKELGVPFVDMNKLTHKLVQELGPNSSKELFMWIPAGKYEFCPKGKIDNTHLTVLGGIVVSRLAVNALAHEVPALRKYIKPEVYNLNN